MTLVVGLSIATFLAWTGLWGRLLTWGEWGTLTVADLIGFLMVAGALLALGLFIVLFTVRATLRQVEVALRVADRKVDRHLAMLSSRVEEAEERAAAQLAEERHLHQRHRNDLLQQVRSEAIKQRNATRADVAHLARAALQSAQVELKNEMMASHPTRLDHDALRDAIASTQMGLDALRAEVAVFEEAMDERTRAACEALAHDTTELHASLIRARAELLRSIESEVHKALRAPPKQREMAVTRSERVRGWLGNGGR